MLAHAPSGLSRFLNSVVHPVFGSVPSFSAGPAGALAVLAAVALVVSSACDKVPLTAPAGTVITLVSGTNVLPINGSTDLIAVLIENGTTSSGTGTDTTTSGSAGTPVHNGTLVTFTTSLGKIEPAEARTNNGRVTVKLTADGRSGTAKITAFSGSASQTAEVVIGAAAAETVSVTLSASSVKAGGGTVTVTARVLDTDGNPLAGVPVTFATTAGTLGAAVAVTNDSGVASTTLSTTTEASVTASAGTITSGTATVSVRASGAVQLTAPSGSVFVGAPASFTVAPQGTVNLSSVTLDYGDGTSATLGAITGSTPRVHYYDSDGIYTVVARATDIDGNVTQASADVAIVQFNFAASASPSSGALGTVFSFSVSGIPTTVGIDHYEWDFGDGTTRQTTTGSTTYEFLQRGAKTVTVTIVPSHGESRTTSFSVSVT